MLGLAKTGGISSNGSGDYMIAFPTAESVRIPYHSEDSIQNQPEFRNEGISPLFIAAIEATEEVIVNSLFQAETMTRRDGHTINALPVERVRDIMKEYGRVKN